MSGHARALIAMALGVLWIVPALGAIDRPLIFLDGDPAARPLDSEEFLLTQANPSRATTEFGSAVAFGDVDGDGTSDAIVGQRADNRVFVYLGARAASGLPYFTDPNAADFTIVAPAGGADAIQQFGFSVAVLDRDGDPNTGVEILIGAPFSDPGGLKDAGLAYLVRGLGSRIPPATIMLNTPPVGVEVLKLTRGSATLAGDLLGFSVGSGRLTGESFIAVGARDADAISPTRVDSGAVHVALGSTLPLTTTTFNLSTGSAVTFFGTDASDAFGEALATCDLDGQGNDDLIVGAIFGDGPANAGLNRGEVFLFLGENLASGQFTGALPASGADMIVYGATNGDDLGFSVACGDLDDDGRDDLAAGAIFADGIGEARPTSGEVYLLAGRNSAPDPNNPARRRLIDPATSAPQLPIDLSVATGLPIEPAPDAAARALYGATTADQLGFALAVGDLDGDRIADLAISARRYDRDQTLANTGAAYLLLGGPGFLGPPAPGQTRAIDLRVGTARPVYPGFDPNMPVDHLPNRVDAIVVGASREDHAGFGLAVGDLNGDGSGELMIGAIGDLARAPGFRGEAYILSFGDRDGDGSSNLLDRDNDNDGIQDDDEDLDGDGIVDPGETDPLNPDTDGDGIQDGTEIGLTCVGGGGTREVACDDPAVPYTSTVPASDPNLPFFRPDLDPQTTTDPLDRDSDEDGIGDGAEDINGDGARDLAETDPANPDTDGDMIFDGTEIGLTAGVPNPGGTDTTAGFFVPDADAGASTTDPTDPDTDGDLINDGVEDADRNGAVAGDANLDGIWGSGEIWTETDPTKTDTDEDGLPDGLEDKNRNGVIDSGETNPLDRDTDDDGLPDGWIDGTNGSPVDGIFQSREGEDRNRDGQFGTNFGESHPLMADSDGDGLLDGTEAGVPQVGGGVLGLSGTGQDGTDTNSPNFRPDGDDGATRTEPWDADCDDDGLPDGFIDGYNANSGGMPGGVIDGMASIYEGEDLNLNGVVDPGETDPEDRDTDSDGVKDGTERGVTAPGVLGPDGLADPASGGVQDGTAPNLQIVLDADDATLTDALDGDTDDDGLSDGTEDANGNGAVGTGESDPNDHDTDGDLIFDGTERGVVTPLADTDPNAMRFRADDDPATVTDPVNPDTDGGGTTDGDEDVDRNGRVDAGERDPLNPLDDDRSGVLEFTDTLNGTTTTAPILPGDMIFVRLDDDTDENVDPNLIETLSVECISSVPDTETVTLSAIDPNSGVFTGGIGTTAAASMDNDGVLTVASSGTITCTYTDAEDPVDVRMAVRGVSLTGGGIPEFDVDVSPAGRVSWTPSGGSTLAPGTMTWNLYRGMVDLLAATGNYTQEAIGCGLTDAFLDDGASPASGGIYFYLAAGVSAGAEGSLGHDSAGSPRPSTQACAP